MSLAENQLFTYCQKFEDLAIQIDHVKSIIEKEKISSRQSDLIKAVSKEITKLYFSNELEPLRSKQKEERSDLYSFVKLSCLDKYTQDRIDLRLQEDFQQFSLENIKNFGPKNSKFVEYAQSDKIQYFRLLGHFKDSAPDENKGGFHRGKKSVYMNFLKMDPNEWFVIFIHEHLHALDKILVDSLAAYADEELVKTLSSYQKKNIAFDQWDNSTQNKLIPWLMAGLNRGFLAEYRAWTVTFELYLEAKSNSKIQNIAWLDDILKYRKLNELLPSFTLRFLSPNWTDPKEDLFSYSVIQFRLLELRKKLLTTTAPFLGPYLSDIVAAQ